jgi:hypothetical protein
MRHDSKAARKKCRHLVRLARVDRRNNREDSMRCREVSEETWRKWHDTMVLDRPLGLPRPTSPGEAVTRVGCCVKTKKKDPNGCGLPENHGLIAAITHDEIVVIDNPIPDGKPRRIWTGSPQQFYTMWMCD